MENKNQFRLSDMKLILKSIYRRKWLLIIPWIMISGIAIAGSYFIPPQYKASTIISVDSQINLSPGMRQMVGLVRNDNWRRNNSDRLKSFYNEITSEVYLSNLDQRLGLSRRPAMQQEIDLAMANMPNMSREQVTIHILQTSLKDRIEVQFAGENQLQISISSPLAIEAADVVNNLGDIFIEEKHLHQISLSRLQGDFSDTQLEKFELRLQEALAAKTQFESYLIENLLSEAVVSMDNQTDILTEILNINLEVERQHLQKQQWLGQLQESQDRRIAAPRLEESGLIKILNTSWRNELASISELILTYPWNSSPIQSLKIRLNKSLTDIEEENTRLVNDQYSDYPASTKNLLTSFFNSLTNLSLYRARGTAVQTGLDELTVRINKIYNDRSMMDQLTQDVSLATRTRDQWNTIQETSSVSQDLFKDFRYRVIDPARIPLVPFKPDRIRIALSGLMLGLVIGGAAVLITELMDNSFKKVEEVQEELGLPVLGIAPKMPFLKKVNS